MALKGNLRDFSTTRLFNLINLACKTGLLTIQNDGATARMYFKAGKLIHAALAGQDGRLTNMLLKTGRISADQSKAIQARAQTKTDKELGLLLINAGYVSQNDIVQSVRAHMLEIVYLLFTWGEGLFHFEPNVLPEEDRITVPVNLENIILEGSRRIEEWEMLQDELPDLDMALRFTERPDARLRNISLSVDEWRIISFINPRNTIRQIAQHNSMNEFQIRKIVYGMLSAGLVELVEPEGRVRKPPPIPVYRPPKRSLVERLINRLRR